MDIYRTEALRGGVPRILHDYNTFFFSKGFQVKEEIVAIGVAHSFHIFSCGKWNFLKSDDNSRIMHSALTFMGRLAFYEEHV